MIHTYIQIEDSEMQDFFDAFGFIYVEGDERMAPDEKEDAVSIYSEEEGEHRDGRTVDAPFDYSATFIVEAPNKNLLNVNAKVSAFNSAIREKKGDVKRIKQITFYNPLHRHKIVGYPSLVTVPEEVYHSAIYGELDYAEVKLKIRVSKPSLCDFNMLDASESIPELVMLSSNGNIRLANNKIRQV